MQYSMIDETVDDRLKNLTNKSRIQYAKRLDRLVGEGYDRDVAERLACGLLPDSMLKWPPTPRYWAAEYEKKGLTRAAAEEETRYRVARWWFDSVEYTEEEEVSTQIDGVCYNVTESCQNG
jgi:hypothetical protein